MGFHRDLSWIGIDFLDVSWDFIHDSYLVVWNHGIFHDIPFSWEWNHPN